MSSTIWGPFFTRGKRSQTPCPNLCIFKIYSSSKRRKGAGFFNFFGITIRRDRGQHYIMSMVIDGDIVPASDPRVRAIRERQEREQAQQRNRQRQRPNQRYASINSTQHRRRPMGGFGGPFGPGDPAMMMERGKLRKSTVNDLWHL